VARGLKFVGRPPIRIAESVRSVATLTNEYATCIMDRGYPIDEDFVDAVVAQSVFGWEGRKPKPALDEEGRFQGTDLDLLSFLVPVAERGAVIEFPHYRSRRPSVRREGERHVGGGSRFGQLTGLTSNQDVFSFSARIFDSTVVMADPDTGRETTGAFRNFMLVDLNGRWHKGWDRIIWDPSAQENAFLNQYDLWTGSTVVFRSAVHPNRWQSIFGAPYLLLKMLVERLKDEARFYFDEGKRLDHLGIRFSGGDGPQESAPLTASATMTQKIEVATLEAVVDTPPFIGAYTEVPATRDGLRKAYEWRKKLLYTMKPKVQFITRADELAYFLHGNQRIASWLEGRRWNSGYKPPRGRVSWEQMVLSNDVALRYRIRKVTQDVASSFSQIV
jgi:hypothetical protein